jgi:hypothetical protein
MTRNVAYRERLLYNEGREGDIRMVLSPISSLCKWLIGCPFAYLDEARGPRGVETGSRAVACFPQTGADKTCLLQKDPLHCALRFLGEVGWTIQGLLTLTSNSQTWRHIAGYDSAGTRKRQFPTLRAELC